MTIYRTSQFMVEMVFVAASIIITAGLVSVEAAGIVDEVCGTQTLKDVSGVEKHLQQSDVHGIELHPLPKFTYAATCGQGIRKITKCAFTSDNATPKTSEVQLDGSHGTAKFTLKKDRLSYDCSFSCYDVTHSAIWCTYPLLDAVCGNKKSGIVHGVQIPVRATDVDGAIIADLPTVKYDADCATKQITKCSIPTKAVAANPRETSNQFQLQEKSNGGNPSYRSCTMLCLPKLIATLNC